MPGSAASRLWEAENCPHPLYESALNLVTVPSRGRVRQCVPGPTDVSVVPSLGVCGVPMPSRGLDAVSQIGRHATSSDGQRYRVTVRHGRRLKLGSWKPCRAAGG